MAADTIIEGIINAAFSGIFSISAIIVAAYAIIARHVEEVFLGMPVSQLRRFKIGFLIVPFILLIMDYIILTFILYNKYIFVILLGVFIIYICIYLILILLPLYNKKEFNRLLTDVYIKRIGILDDETFESYLIEMIKSLNYKNITAEIYNRVFKAYKLKINHDQSPDILHKIMVITENLFISDNKSFFVEMYDLNISLEYKIIYINSIYSNLQGHRIINIEQFVNESKDFIKSSLKRYLHDSDYAKIRNHCIVLINNIIIQGGLKLFLTDIYQDDITELRYLEIIVEHILIINKTEIVLKLDDEDANFINQIESYFNLKIENISSKKNKQL